MLNKEAIIARAKKWGHVESGRVIKALRKVLDASYPTGTNRVLMYVVEFIGLAYGHVDKCMDKVTDCAEFWRTTFYIWFGIDIGTYSDGEYKSKYGKFVTKDFKAMSTCRPLDLAFYDVSSTDNKITGHVAGIFDAKRIFQSGAASNRSKVNFSPISWLPRGKTSKCFKGVKRFLTDAQYDSVIVKNEGEVKEDMITTGSDSKLVMQLQTKLKALGHDLGAYGTNKDGIDGDYGDKTKAAVMAVQKAAGLGQTGKADEWTLLAICSLLEQKKDAALAMLKSQVRAESATLAALGK